MSPRAALGAAFADLYHQSWRLFLLNAGLSAVVLPIIVAGLWVPAVWILLVAAGPPAAALMHCAVVLTVTDELRLRDALTGLRLHWRRGLLLGAFLGAGAVAGVYAITFYAARGALVLAVLGVYLLVVFGVFQLVLWPLAVSERAFPIRLVAAQAGKTLLARPFQSIALGLALARRQRDRHRGGADALPHRHDRVLVSCGGALRATADLDPGGARPMAGVKFDHVTKEFDGTAAVKDLTIEVEDGEFLVLVGPSGCGKSTALRMLAGLEEITDGRIMIGDRIVNNVAPGARDIAMVFQSYALYPHMTVYDNLAFGLRNKGFPKKEIDARVRRTSAILDLDPLIKRKPKQLSGGQRQRVALGRAIVREPAAFLMDEPLSNLDAQLRVATRAEILKLQESLGTTTIYVTHDQIEAMTMGDRIAVMRLGVLQQIGTPEELYTQPARTCSWPASSARRR